MEEALQKLAEKVLLWLPEASVGLLIFFVFWFAGILGQRIVTRLGRRTCWAEDVTSLLARGAKLALVIFGVVTALGTMGINVSALVAGSGLTGFALGFALKDALSNLLAGILLLSYRPFHHGQFIEVAGQKGTVMDMDFRYTTLESDGMKVLIPNSSLFTNTVVVSGDGPESKAIKSKLDGAPHSTSPD
jgi:small conductance mechanosensitive channel